MTPRWRRHHQARDPSELNITAFLNLMVILVPFLLITAVFSRLAILEVALPAPDSTVPEQQDEEPVPPPTVIVRPGIVVLRMPAGNEVGFEKQADGYDLDALNSALQIVKAQDASKDAAVILLEPGIEYDTLIQVMDAVRIATEDQSADAIERPLFPQISLGEAPAEAAAP